MNWILIAQIVYVLILVFICMRIIYDTKSTTKALAYIMLAIFVPILGILFYLGFGVNKRKRKLYDRKSINDEELSKKIRENLVRYSRETLADGGTPVESNQELVLMLLKDSKSALTPNNSVELLINGENKFPSVFKAIEEAKHHIHIQYYIYHDDVIGKQVEEALLKKASEGVIVRFIYDDFGSRSVRKRLVPNLKKNGIKASPFHKVIFLLLANRINYRNHRKIIVIDGVVGFVGGINVSDKYINDNKPSKKSEQKLYWRDTHIKIEGPGVQYLQYLFMSDWNFCTKDCLEPDELYFPKPTSIPIKGNKIVQIAASGPDSDKPTILYSLLQAINLAKEEVLITTPYFIPGDSLLDALIVSALGGVKVKLLVPGKSDSKFVNAAARSYYDDIIAAGVEIYQYTRGFVHSKSLVADGKIAVIGSANIDHRSFDLNFEVNAIIYDIAVAKEMRDIFFEDIRHAELIDPEVWKNRP
ncbi:MAG: cardiolipin synthase, partial [Saprospiraceae bacterium]